MNDPEDDLISTPTPDPSAEIDALDLEAYRKTKAYRRELDERLRKAGVPELASEGGAA